jgi:hypothetical protein
MVASAVRPAFDKEPPMPQRHTPSVFAVLLLATLAVAPLAVAAESPRVTDRASSFFTDPVAFLGTWLGHLLGFESALGATQTAGCGEAGAHIDPDGRCVGTSNSDAGPDIDPDGR